MDEILTILEKYYVHYEKYKNQLLKIKNIDELNKFWYNDIKEHGGYLSADEVKEWMSGKNIPKSRKTLPVIDDDNIFVLPTMVVNDEKFQKEYIKVGNDLLIKNFKNKEAIIIDLTKNYGGKTEVMAAAISPILNILPNGSLTFISKGNLKIDDLEKKSLGCYKTKYYDIACGSKAKLSNLRSITVKVNSNTCSAGEMIAISMIAFLKHCKNINFKMVGESTCGFTTSIKSFNLSDGAMIEVPIGYYSDIFGIIYKKGLNPNLI